MILILRQLKNGTFVKEELPNNLDKLPEHIELLVRKYGADCISVFENAHKVLYAVHVRRV